MGLNFIYPCLGTKRKCLEAGMDDYCSFSQVTTS